MISHDVSQPPFCPSIGYTGFRSDRPGFSTMDFTEPLANLPDIRLDDVKRLADTFSLTTRSKLDKGYKFYIEQYLFNYQGKWFCLV